MFTSQLAKLFSLSLLGSSYSYLIAGHLHLYVPQTSELKMCSNLNSSPMFHCFFCNFFFSWSPIPGNNFSFFYSHICSHQLLFYHLDTSISSSLHSTPTATALIQVCSLSYFVQSLCLTLCDPMDYSMSGFPVLNHLPEFAQTHVHWVGDDIQPSHPLPSPSPPAFNLSQHQSLFQWVCSLHQVVKVVSVLPVNIQGWFQDWLVWSPCCPRDTQESSPAPQFKSISFSSAFFMVQLSHPYMTTGKTTALTIGPLLANWALVSNGKNGDYYAHLTH